MFAETLKGLNAVERRRILLDNAHSRQEDVFYQRDLTEAELDARRAVLGENEIALAQLDVEKKEFMDEWKAKRSPLNMIKGKTLNEIKNRQESRSGTLYNVISGEREGYFEVYNEEGELIEERRMRPDERQGNMFISGGRAARRGDESREGTND